jgi:hypothetical protein
VRGQIVHVNVHVHEQVNEHVDVHESTTTDPT